MAGATIPELIPFIKARIRICGECWIWSGGKTMSGYGTLKLGRGRTGRKNYMVHRVMWEHFNGREIPDGFVIRHTCDTPSCVNPLHLEVGTHQDNMDDMAEKGRAARGTKHPRAALTQSQVIRICEIANGTHITHAEIARRFNVSRPTITKILNRQTYRDCTSVQAVY